MSDINMNIWGREFSLKVEFDAYPGESIEQVQNDALNEFRNIASDSFAEAEGKVKDYIISNADGWPKGKYVDNIFKYVLPRSIFVPRKQTEHTVAILCDFRFDTEHGLAIIFSAGKLKEIGPEDIIL